MLNQQNKVILEECVQPKRFCGSEADTDVEDDEFSSVDEYFEYKESMKKKSKRSVFDNDDFFAT